MRIHKLRSLLYGLVLLPMSIALADESLVIQQELNKDSSSGNSGVVHMQAPVTWTDRVESLRNLFNYGYAYTDMSGCLKDVHTQEFVETLQKTEEGKAFLAKSPISLRTTLGRQDANLDFLTLYNYAQFAAGTFNFVADPSTFSAETQEALREWCILIQRGEVTQALKGLRQFAAGNRDAFVGALQVIDKASAYFQKAQPLGEWAKFLGDVVIYPATDILALTNFLNQLVNDRETLASIASQAYQAPHSFGELGNAWGAQIHFMSAARGVTFLIDWIGKKLPQPVVPVAKSFLEKAQYVRAMTFENFLTEPLINGAFSWGLWGLGVSDETSSFLGKVSSLSTMWYLFSWNPYILGISGGMYVATSYDKIWISLQNMYGSSAYAVSSGYNWGAESWLGQKIGSAWRWFWAGGASSPVKGATDL